MDQKQKQTATYNSTNEEDEEMHDEEKKRRLETYSTNPAKRAGVICCQAENCHAELSDAKKYHRRHKVCELHSKAPAVVVGGLIQRFCQQCSRFHELSEFDDTKRSCRRRLVGHNERRRKSSSESKGEGSNQCRQADQGSTSGGSRVDIQITSMTSSNSPRSGRAGAQNFSQRRR